MLNPKKSIKDKERKEEKLMKAILKGYEHSEGEYEGRKYNSYKLHCVSIRETEGVKGLAVSVVKVTPTVFETFMQGKTDEMIIDKKVDIEIAQVNQKNVVQYVELVK